MRVNNKMSSHMKAHNGYYNAKIVLVGDVAVGKTSIVRQFAEKFFLKEYYMTIGVDYNIKELDIPNPADRMRPYRLRYQLWDTAGQERFRSITSAYYRDATCIILVFSLVDPATFDRIVDVWYPEVVKMTNPHTHIILVGNKKDLYRFKNAAFERRVDSWAKERAMPYYTVDVMDSETIQDIFKELGAEVMRLTSSGLKMPGMRCVDIEPTFLKLNDMSSSDGEQVEFQKKWYEFWKWCF